MFRKLRNKMLLTNMIITLSLVISCLVAIFITTNISIDKDINSRLDRVSRMYMNDLNKPQSNIKHNITPPENPSDSSSNAQQSPNNNPPPEKPTDSSGNAQQPPDDAPPPDREFDSDIAIYAATDGSIISIKSNMTAEITSYSDTVSDIIKNAKSKGTIEMGGKIWTFQFMPFKDGLIIAFIQTSDQKHMLFLLATILILAAIFSTGISFIISLIIANKSIKPIEESYNKQKQFVADASHELRTPLASIAANTDVLLSKSDSSIAAEHKWLEYIKDETVRMTQLTNDLLYLAKSDSGESEKILTLVSLSDILEDTLLECEAVAFEKNVHFDYSVKNNLNILASSSSLKQLILILTDNAIKYTPEKGDINVTATSSSGNAVITFTNTGSILSEDLPHLFERFYRADKSRSRESGGYGLGLAIAKSICDSFKGSIEAKSKNNTTEFIIKFPLA